MIVHNPPCWLHLQWPKCSFIGTVVLPPASGLSSSMNLSAHSLNEGTKPFRWLYREECDKQPNTVFFHWCFRNWMIISFPTSNSYFRITKVGGGEHAGSGELITSKMPFQCYLNALYVWNILTQIAVCLHERSFLYPANNSLFVTVGRTECTLKQKEKGVRTWDLQVYSPVPSNPKTNGIIRKA